MTDSIKAWLYKKLGLKKYLQLLQTFFLFEYKTGLLKFSSNYRWHYFVKKLIQKDDTIIDIGANLGYFSYVFSGIINSSEKLFSVEPVNLTENFLKKFYRKKITLLFTRLPLE